MEATIKVLLVEDDLEDFKIFKSYLSTIKRSNFEIERVFNYEDSLKLMLKKEHDIYLLDYYLGQKNGLDLMKEALSLGFNRPVIFLTGRKNSDTDLEALQYGAYDYLVKDYVNAENLERSIKYALSKFNLENQLRDQKVILETILENSPVGICVTNKDMFINHWNSQFKNMFGLDEGDMINCLDKILVFEKKKDDIYSKEYESIEFPFGRIVPNKTITFEGKITTNSVSIHCITKYKTIIIKNGKDKIYKVFSFINTDKYYEREKRLIDTVNKAEVMIKKYAEKEVDPKAYLDLADLEVTKMRHTMNVDALGV